MGKFLRALKLDELPQLWNVIRGDMSLVGPRPLVPEQVMRSSNGSQANPALRPGLTSLASAYFRREGEYLGGVIDRDEFYERRILPVKEMLNQQYAEQLSLLLDLKIIFLTAFLLFFPGKSREGTIQLGNLKFRVYSRPAQIVIDFSIFVAAINVAYWFRYEGTEGAYLRAQLALLMLVLPLARWIVNRLAGVYDQVWRHFSISDLITIINATVVSTAILLALRFFLKYPPEQFPYPRVPLGVIGGEFLLTSFMLVGARILRKSVYEIDTRYHPPQEPDLKRVLIAGAGRSGLVLAEDLSRNPQFEVVGFIDDDQRKIGKRMGGRYVLGSCADLPALVHRFRINHVVSCYPSPAEIPSNRLREICASVGVGCTPFVNFEALIMEKGGNG